MLSPLAAERLLDLVRLAISVLVLALHLTSNALQGAARVLGILSSLLSFTVVFAVALSFMAAGCQVLAAVLDGVAALLELGAGYITVAKKGTEQVHTIPSRGSP